MRDEILVVGYSDCWMFMSSRDEMYPHCCMVNEFLMELYVALLFCMLWKITHVLFCIYLFCSVGGCYCCISYVVSECQC